ncbi:MAG: hypothetical protein ACKVQJ_12020 [Pyrinomonadaceae bacterium]
MKKQVSDEQLDKIMRTLVNDASLSDAKLNEIADSPTMWWGVQRKIGIQKETIVSPWPPIGKLWRWGIVGLPTAAAAALLISFVAFRSVPNVEPDRAGLSQQPMPANVVIEQPEVPSAVPMAPEGRSKTELTRATVKPSTRQRAETKISTTTFNASTKKTEVKTEFIALSYARNPESGQIVRVKVPSSMMVTLGLVASVEKPSNLVDAEVLVGDDGLTRAIRFIH